MAVCLRSKAVFLFSMSGGEVYHPHPGEQPGIPRTSRRKTYVGLTVPGRCFLKSKQNFPTSGPKSKPRRDEL